MYTGNRPHYYNNYNNIGNMDLYSIDNINDLTYNEDYIKDIILSEARKNRHKKKISSMDYNINNNFDINKRDNFNRLNWTNKKNNNNDNLGKIVDKFSSLNNELYKNAMKNNYIKYKMKQNDNINIETFEKFKEQKLNSPYRYPRIFPKSNEINNNHININRNNEILRNENLTLNKNINIINNRNNNISDVNNINNNILYYVNKKQQQYQVPKTMMKRERFNNQPMNINNNINLNINNKNNVIYGKIPNLRSRAENPNQKVNNNLKNDFSNNTKQNNKKERNNNNLNKNILNNIKKRKIDEEQEDEENLSNLADDLFNLQQENKIKKNKIENNHSNNNININKNKEEEKIINNDVEIKEASTRNKKNQVEEFGCQAELSKNSNYNNSNSSRINSNSNRTLDKKNVKVDSSNDIQTSLMPFLQVESFNNLDKINKKIELQISNVNCFNIIQEKKEDSKNDESKKINEFQLTDVIPTKDKNEIKLEEIKINNDHTNALNKNRKNSSNFQSENDKIIYDKSQSEKSKDFKLGEEIIDSDNEKEIEEKEKKKKKKRRIKFDLNQNIYFNFLQNDIMTYCQVKKGPNGDLENYQPKSDVDKMDSLIMFELKSAIKAFKKEEIKVDKNYQLRENMEERNIIPELYEDEEVDENIVNDIANSLKSSIDKSTDASINESLRRSITQSYNQSMVGSLLASFNNNEGQGLLKKLTAAFGESLNPEE